MHWLKICTCAVLRREKKATLVLEAKRVRLVLLAIADPRGCLVRLALRVLKAMPVRPALVAPPVTRVRPATPVRAVPSGLPVPLAIAALLAVKAIRVKWAWMVRAGHKVLVVSPVLAANLVRSV